MADVDVCLRAGAPTDGERQVGERLSEESNRDSAAARAAGAGSAPELG